MRDNMLFYKETNLKSTTIGGIPEDWKLETASDLFTVVTGTTPSTKKREYWDDGSIDWITPTDLSKLHGKLRIRSGERRITEKALKEINLTLMPKGSLILSTRAPVGYVAVLEEEAAFNQGCKGLIPKNSEEILSEFYCYYLSNKKQMLQNLSSGSTFKELSKDRLERFAIPHLPIKEQKAVVGVLGVVDSAIELVDRVIWKTERLKKGLMQTLLTKGIGHKEYKDTPIGKIPKEWRFGKLVDFSKTKDSPVQTGPFGAQLHASDYARDGVPLILIKNVLDGQIIEDDMPRVAETKASELTRYRLKAGDIVFSRVGSVGRAAVIRKHQEDWLVSGQMLRVRLENPEIDNDFLGYAIATTWFQKTLASRTVGATRKSINTEILSNLPMVVPNILEQRRIANLLLDVDKKLELERKEKMRLERVKRGLMDLLLTGKVRVKVD
jgi:type I restriction enzyme S subunit